MKNKLAERKWKTKSKVKVQYYRINRLNYRNYKFKYFKKLDVKKKYTRKSLQYEEKDQMEIKSKKKFHTLESCLATILYKKDP